MFIKRIKTEPEPRSYFEFFEYFFLQIKIMLSLVLFCAFEPSFLANSPLLSAKRKFKIIKKITKSHNMKKFKTAS